MLDNSAGTVANITARDFTEGVLIEDTGRGIIGAQTVRPVARVRASELTANSISFDELDAASIAFNGHTWRIESHRSMPSPGGELAGEVMLILIQTA